MQQITATLRILGTDGRPTAGLTLVLEAFSLAGGWSALASARTGEDGVARFSARPEAPAQGALPVHAPALRVIEKADGAGPRVLATGGLPTYGGARNPVLAVDFGEVERLDAAAFALRSSAGQPQDRLHVVAGLPRRGDIAMATLTRTLGDRTITPTGPLSDAVAAGSAPAAPTAATAAPLSSVSVDRFNAELLTFSARESALRADLSQRDLQLDEARKRLKEVEDSAATAAARLAEAERDKAAAEADAAALRAAASREAPIHDIAFSIGKEAAVANTAMETEAAGFRIAKLQVSLQGSVAPGGERIALANAADALKGGGGGLQGIVIDYVPDRKPVAPPTGTPVPDLLGLTESAARRALAAAGLGISVATRPGAATGRFAVGQAVQQAPAAGQPLPPGEAVIVVFAAP
ncbi:MAG: PASTA domain-containing protein [Alkalilacustris sp.]